MPCIPGRAVREPAADWWRGGSSTGSGSRHADLRGSRCPARAGSRALPSSRRRPAAAHLFTGSCSRPEFQLWSVLASFGSMPSGQSQQPRLHSIGRCSHRTTCNRERANPTGRMGRATFTGHCLTRGHPRQCRPTYAAASVLTGRLVVTDPGPAPERTGTLRRLAGGAFQSSSRSFTITRALIDCAQSTRIMQYTFGNGGTDDTSARRAPLNNSGAPCVQLP